jgi:hypothetical protein
MPEMNVEDFKFPDEKQESQEQEELFEVEIEDDTPPEDRGREPMPKSLIEELEQDELDQYDDNVKQKLKQMRKVWHDERREKEKQLQESSKKLLRWLKSCLKKTRSTSSTLSQALKNTLRRLKTLLI